MKNYQICLARQPLDSDLLIELIFISSNLDHLKSYILSYQPCILLLCLQWLWCRRAATHLRPTFPMNLGLPVTFWPHFLMFLLHSTVLATLILLTITHFTRHRASSTRTPIILIYNSSNKLIIMRNLELWYWRIMIRMKFFISSSSKVPPFQVFLIINFRKVTLSLW